MYITNIYKIAFSKRNSPSWMVFHHVVLQLSGEPKGTSTNPMVYTLLKLFSLNFSKTLSHILNKPWWRMCLQFLAFRVMQDREKLVPNIHSNPARSQFARNKSCTRAESGGIEPDCLQHVYNTASIFDHFTILKENYVSVLNCAIIWYHLMTEFWF